MPDGKYFMFVSKLSGCALGPEGGNTGAGARLVTLAKTDGDDRILYFIDPLTGTMRNKASGLCITAEGESNAVFQPYAAGKAGQQKWVFANNTIKNSTDGRVLDITGESSACNVPVCCWAHHGHNNQLWDRVAQPAKFFTLKGEASGRALDISGMNKSPGAKICIYDENKGDNQQWYEDSAGLIRAKLNDFVFDDTDGSGDICMQPYEANNPHRSWILHGAAVAQLSNPEVVLDVRKESNENGATVCAYKNRNAGHQKWKVQYV